MIADKERERQREGETNMGTREKHPPLASGKRPLWTTPTA